MNVDTLLNIVGIIAIIVDIVAILALIVYCGILLLYAISPVKSLGWVVDLVKKWPAHAFDLPMSGIAAFAIVSLLRGATGGSLEFTAFGLQFTGPAGPTTLWVVVFLSIVVSFKLLK